MDVIITRRKTLFRGRDHCQIVLQSPGEKLVGKEGGGGGREGEEIW